MTSEDTIVFVIRNKIGTYPNGSTSKSKGRTYDISGEKYTKSEILINKSDIHGYGVEDQVITANELKNMDKGKVDKAPISGGPSRSFQTRAIPYGTYVLKESGSGFPVWVYDVPNYTSIKVHMGESALNSDGCLISSATDGEKEGYVKWDNNFAKQTILGYIRDAKREGKKTYIKYVTNAEHKQMYEKIHYLVDEEYSDYHKF